jgi:hypothetical membrane protein
MKALKEKISKIKKIHSVVSSTLFFIVLLFCIFNVSELSLAEISLSHYGINHKTGIVWNTSLFILGVLLYIQSLRNIFRYYQNDKADTNIIIYFSISSLFLLLTAVVDMSFKIHNFFAVSYFIGYTISIFLFGYNLLKNDFRIGISSIIISLACLIFPILTTYFFKGWAIPEIIHTVFILLWVLVLSFDTEYKNILKKIGF